MGKDALLSGYEKFQRNFRLFAALSIAFLGIVACAPEVGDVVEVRDGQSVPLVETIGLQNPNCLLSGDQKPEGVVRKVLPGEESDWWVYVKATGNPACMGWAPANAFESIESTNE